MPLKDFLSIFIISHFPACFSCSNLVPLALLQLYFPRQKVMQFCCLLAILCYANAR